MNVLKTHLSTSCNIFSFMSLTSLSNVLLISSCIDAASTASTSASAVGVSYSSIEDAETGGRLTRIFSSLIKYWRNSVVPYRSTMLAAVLIAAFILSVVAVLFQFTWMRPSSEGTLSISLSTQHIDQYLF